MHINLNNPGEHFLQLSPLIGRAQQQAPSPMLSPDPLFLDRPPSEDTMRFRLEQPEEELQQDFIGSLVNYATPPIPYPSNIDPMESSLIHSHSQHGKTQDPPLFSRKRKEPRATKSIEIKTQDLPPIRLPSSDLPPIRAIIEFMVQNSTQPEKELIEKGNQLWGQSQDLSLILKTLAQKFKKLKKTKEEMTKYCMRKVFKFIADRMRKDRTHNRDVDTCMKIYFSKAQNGNTFSIPFKKNSIDKTMNGNFLKRVFASETFVNDYKEFLREFQDLMMDDNEKKILYLADILQKYIRIADFKKIEGIKRLPWSREILQQTEQLAVGLLTYADQKREEEEEKDQ